MGEPLAPREHDRGGIVVEVAAADHLAAVEADRDRLRAAITEALAHLDRHPLTRTDEPMCATCHARRVLADALDAGSDGGGMLTGGIL